MKFYESDEEQWTTKDGEYEPSETRKKEQVFKFSVFDRHLDKKGYFYVRKSVVLNGKKVEKTLKFYENKVIFYFAN